MKYINHLVYIDVDQHDKQLMEKLVGEVKWLKHYGWWNGWTAVEVFRLLYNDDPYDDISVFILEPCLPGNDSQKILEELKRVKYWINKPIVLHSIERPIGIEWLEFPFYPKNDVTSVRDMLACIYEQFGIDE